MWSLCVHVANVVRRGLVRSARVLPRIDILVGVWQVDEQIGGVVCFHASMW